jgi:hypothetical protein
MRLKLSRNPKLATILVFALIALLAACNNINKRNETSNAMAMRGLNTFKLIVKKGNTSKLLGGGASPDEVDQAVLGDKIKVYFIRLDSIKQYHPNEGPSVLFDVHEDIYPVLNKIKTKVITSEIVELNAGTNKWEVAGFGSQGTIMQYETFSKAVGFAAKPYLVRIPGLSLNFMGGELNNKPNLIYLGTQAFDSIAPGDPMLLDDVLRQLQPKAIQTTLFP